MNGKQMRYFSFLMGFLTLIVIPACTGGTAPVSVTTSGLEAWIDQPSQPDGTVLPMEPFTLKAHARNQANGGVSQIVFLVNSVPPSTFIPFIFNLSK